MQSLSRRLALLSVLASCFGGCASQRQVVSPTGASAPMSVGHATADRLMVRYRTQSDRLHVSAGSLAATPVSMSSFESLPAVTTSILDIRHPHPDGRTDVALVRVVVSQRGREGEAAKWLVDGPSAAPPPLGYWAMDIPKWQLDGVLKKLEEQRFYSRSKVLGAAAYLFVARGEKGFGKEYRPVAELDSLILRATQAGRPNGPVAGRPISRPSYLSKHPLPRPAQLRY